MDIKSIKNISTDTISINGTSITANETVDVFYDVNMFSKHAGDILEHVTRDQIELYDETGTLITGQDRFNQINKTANMISQGSEVKTNLRAHTLKAGDREVSSSGNQPFEIKGNETQSNLIRLENSNTSELNVSVDNPNSETPTWQLTTNNKLALGTTTDKNKIVIDDINGVHVNTSTTFNDIVEITNSMKFTETQTSFKTKYSGDTANAGKVAFLLNGTGLKIVYIDSSGSARESNILGDIY